MPSGFDSTAFDHEKFDRTPFERDHVLTQRLHGSLSRGCLSLTVHLRQFISRQFTPPVYLEKFIILSSLIFASNQIEQILVHLKINSSIEFFQFFMQVHLQLEFNVAVWDMRSVA